MHDPDDLPPHLRDNPEAARAYHTADATLSAVLRLEAARKAAGLTQTQMAGRLGVTRRTIHQWETDDTGRIPLGQYMRWLAVCGTDEPTNNEEADHE